MRAVLQPIKETHQNPKSKRTVETVEKALVIIDGYPHFLLHIDVIWDASRETGNHALYEKINNGERVTVDITIRE